MALNTIVTNEGVTVTWEGKLTDETMLTINKNLIVPVGSWIAMTNGEAFQYIAEWLNKNK
jgi:hypothetical protein